MARWLEANGRKQNIWCSCDLGPASPGISTMLLFVLNTHITSFHFIFHTQKLRSCSSPITQREVHSLARLVGGFSSKAPLQEWFQSSLLNLAVEPQLNDCGRERIGDIQWSATGLTFCQVRLCRFYLILTTQLRTQTGLLGHSLSLPSPSSPWPSGSHTDLYSWHPALTWWALGASNFCFVPRSKAAAALNG